MSDFELEDTLFFRFTTRAFATGIPTVLAGTPAIDIYEDDSTTQVITGETLTVDFDGVVGLNLITVTATAATGFELGKSYCCIIQAGTVGGVSVVGEVVKEFTLGMSAAAKDLANGTDGLGVIKTDTAAILVDVTGINGDAMRGTDSALLAASINLTAGAVDNVTLVATTTANTDMRGTDGVDTAAMRGTDSALLAANINLTAGTVDRVTLVDTTTANTDMRGTDGVDTATMRGTDGVDTATMRGTDGVDTSNILTQVNAALDTAISELAQAAPTVTPTLRTGLMLLYMTLRNRLDVDTSGTDEFQVHNDAGTVIAKKLLTDDGADFSEAEMVSGP